MTKKKGINKLIAIYFNYCLCTYFLSGSSFQVSQPNLHNEREKQNWSHADSDVARINRIRQMLENQDFLMRKAFGTKQQSPVLAAKMLHRSLKLPCLWQRTANEGELTLLLLILYIKHENEGKGVKYSQIYIYFKIQIQMKWP